MIDLVKTHLTHPWGPPWTLETLGDHWRPLATCLKMTILGDILGALFKVPGLPSTVPNLYQKPQRKNSGQRQTDEPAGRLPGVGEVAVDGCLDGGEHPQGGGAILNHNLESELN